MALLDVSSAEQGTYLFHLASMYGHATVVGDLLSRYRLDVDRSTSETGRTAFSISSEKGHFDILKLLITFDEPADFNKGWCSSNWTPKLIICDLDSNQQLPSTPASTEELMTSTSKPSLGMLFH